MWARPNRVMMRRLKEDDRGKNPDEWTQFRLTWQWIKDPRLICLNLYYQMKDQTLVKIKERLLVQMFLCKRKKLHDHEQKLHRPLRPRPRHSNNGILREIHPFRPLCKHKLLNWKKFKVWLIIKVEIH